MKLKRADTVKLLPTYSVNTIDSPIWGGSFGYRMGLVTKVRTASHNPADHRAEVEWASPGGSGKSFRGEFQEKHLEKVSEEERNLCLDSFSTFPVDRDIFVLIRTTAQNFALNVIECLPFGFKDPKVKCIAGITREKLETPHNSDRNLVDAMLSTTDFAEERLESLFMAGSKIFQAWGLPEFDYLPLPLPEFPSISAAAQHAEKGPSVAFFHLPKNVADYADDPPK